MVLVVAVAARGLLLYVNKDARTGGRGRGRAGGRSCATSRFLPKDAGIEPLWASNGSKIAKDAGRSDSVTRAILLNTKYVEGRMWAYIW